MHGAPISVAALILALQVQDDIQHLRAAAARAGEGELDLQALDAAIARTEKRIQVQYRYSTHGMHHVS